MQRTMDEPQAPLTVGHLSISCGRGLAFTLSVMVSYYHNGLNCTQVLISTATVWKHTKMCDISGQHDTGQVPIYDIKPLLRRLSSVMTVSGGILIRVKLEVSLRMQRHIITICVCLSLSVCYLTSPTICQSFFSLDLSLPLILTPCLTLFIYPSRVPV